MKKDNNHKLISTSEAAKILDISRVAVFKKIQSGELIAEKVGRNYVISSKDVDELGNPMVSVGIKHKQKIEKALDRTIKEYRETLELLGKQDQAK
jgi:excisionase family DNA binding protein